MSDFELIARVDALTAEVAGLRRARRRSRLALIGGAVAAVALVGGGVAFAVMPDAGTGVIHGCYDTTSGALRVIDPASQSCSASESALNWNMRGVNWRGAWSPTASYAVGDAVAYNGSSYLAVAANIKSRPLSKAWSTLSAGMQWLGAWTVGKSYYAGSVVSYQGSSYLATKASTGVTPTDTSVWSVLAGRGQPGSDGASVLNGSGPPDDSLGADGDFYLDTAADAIYGPKTGGSWPTSGTDLVGPKGDPGPGAVSIDSENNDNPQTADLSGVGVSVSAVCGANGNGLATLDITGSGPFSISGTYYANGAASVVTSSGNVYQVAAGVSERDDNNQSGTFEIDAATTAHLSAQLLITSGGSVADLDVFLAGSQSIGCEVRGVGVPTG